MTHPYTAKYIAELLAEHKEHVNVGNRLYAEAPVYDFAEIIEQQMAHIKELETVNQVIAKEFRDLIFREGYSCPLCGGAFKPGSPHEDDCPIAPEGGDA